MASTANPEDLISQLESKARSQPGEVQTKAGFIKTD
jgi:hypothetical protein